MSSVTKYKSKDYFPVTYKLLIKRLTALFNILKLNISDFSKRIDTAVHYIHKISGDKKWMKF